jgi:DNA-binding response OmpR family regulator
MAQRDAREFSSSKTTRLPPLMTEYLGTNGFEIEVVASGEGALERAVHDPPAHVSLDITLAGALDGWEVLTALKAKSRDREHPGDRLFCRERSPRGGHSRSG